MRVSTHRAITKAVAYALGIRGGALLEAMLRGVEEPDRSPEEEVQMKVSRSGNIYFTTRRVRHHTSGNRGRIMKRLWRARKCWLKKKPVEAAFHLGYALHYIQDRCIGSWNHEAVESGARSIPIPLWAIDAAVKSAKPSPSFLEEILARLGPTQTASLALENASAASAYAAAAVFGPTHPPAKLIKEAEAKRGRHRGLLLLTILSAAAGLIALPAAPAAAPIALLTAAASYAVDGKYRRLMKELKWFKP